ncbi:hypothetical protein BBF96_09365 [Anoxybacter fermentans]|uniref:DUF2225 domain-containing protein n=1 Tax=Anoxybacter fermentans TaxID=1323375 RepID=A0A3Q9HQZ3_9FIRM|nr:DUF2225 domain-containing protein [Anoxybacter fermentans]AZR73579.1 hypothetical protein BBF96_09365 [Anoxybacter fermentans]
MSNNPFYKKKVTCPICLIEFETTLVKSHKCIPSDRDTDFCNYYSDVIPYLYDIWVCPQCYYAAPKSIFNKIKKDEINAIAEILAKSNLKLNPLGERKPKQALIYFKLALLCMSYREVPASTIAGVCLKTAWIYRLLKDSEKEEEYLKKAIKFYKKAFSTESFPIGNLTEIHLIYLLGELHRRIKEFPEAIQWFDKVVKNPLASTEPAIVKMARDQWALAKKEYDQFKKEVAATTTKS